MTAKHYPDIDPNPNFAALEQEILDFWAADHTFEKSVANRPATKPDGSNNAYVFYDGPPFANGLPHYGHLLTGYVKDAIARYHTMRGARVERRFGWDCHGLPAEMGAEKDLGISGRAAIMNYGIDKFNAHCETSVMTYRSDWRYYVTRQGRWVDFDHDYKTMDKDFMESVLWAFSELHKKGLVYESMRVMPYSWAAETPLSTFETRLDNATREREDKAAYVKFKLKKKPKGAPDAENYYLVAWTTTPWTLPSNLALAVNAEMEYACIAVSSDASAPSSPLAGERTSEASRGGTQPLLHAKSMRKDPTHWEQKLWNRLKSEQIGGYRFRRQEPVNHYIVDFVNYEKRVVVEADGSQHLESEYDKERDAYLKQQGFTVLRFWNNEIDENIDGVCERILEALSVTPHGSLRSPTPPQGGSKGVSYYFVASSAAPKLLEALKGDQVGVFKGTALINLTYEPLFPYFASTPGAFRVLDGTEFVTDGDGTGIVHMAPGFGEIDQQVCAKNGIEVIVPVDGQGKYTDAIYDLPDLKLRGLNVIADTHLETADLEQHITDKDVAKFGLVNMRILRWLKNPARNMLVKDEVFKHNYPHCWRTDTPLIYRAMPSWYIEVTKFRDRAVEINKQIRWIPDHIRDGQMGHMLATAPDWSISRNRFWGTPIPVWRSPSGKIKVFGSIAELEAASGQKIDNLHRPMIDDVVIHDGGEEFRRVEDVFDCWFESGSMPFAQLHYPFENKQQFEENFPADFITEYVGQTRGWFNTLIMLATAIFDKPPFLNCICHGVVLDSESGLKYSKRLKNYKDPKEVMDNFGADALRWMMLASPVMRGADLSLDPEGKFIRDVVRLNIKPMWSAFNFFTLYANADGIRANAITSSENLLDRYILAKARATVEQVRTSLDAYDTPGATEAITGFFDVLNNWYIRRSRPRFWATQTTPDKQAAYDTLYTVLNLMCLVSAPLLPFVSEAVYRGLNGASSSVHLQDFPDVREIDISEELVADMDWVRDVCNAGSAIRNKQNIRNRQPLASLSIYGQNPLWSRGFKSGDMARYNKEWGSFKTMIEEELNVKEAQLFVMPEEFEKVASRKLQIYAQVLGKRLPEKMKQILPASKKGEWEYKTGEGVIIAGELLKAKDGEYNIVLEPKTEFKDSAQATGDNVVVLDLTITPELEAEGRARDLVRMIQQARKDAGLHVADRITLALDVPGDFKAALATHGDFIAAQTLATGWSEGSASAAQQIHQELDGAQFVIGITKAA